MPTLYWISVTIHVLAAMLWLGGMFFLGVVGAPILRHVEPPALRQQLFQRIGVGFRRVGWIAIGVLVITGTVNLYYRGFLRWSGVLNEPAFWASSTGHALAAKLFAVLVMLATSFVHDFLLGPAAGREAAGSLRAVGLRKQAAWLARVNVLFGVALVVAAVRLARS